MGTSSTASRSNLQAASTTHIGPDRFRLSRRSGPSANQALSPAAGYPRDRPRGAPRLGNSISCVTWRYASAPGSVLVQDSNLRRTVEEVESRETVTCKDPIRPACLVASHPPLMVI